MKTNVTKTSIESYHAHPCLASQRKSVAEFILKETKAGRWTWISKIADNARAIGHVELLQKSSAARALNELKKAEVILISGVEYVLVKSAVLWKPPGSVRRVEQWAIRLKSYQSPVIPEKNEVPVTE